MDVHIIPGVSDDALLIPMPMVARSRKDMIATSCRRVNHWDYNLEIVYLTLVIDIVMCCGDIVVAMKFNY